MSLVAEIAARLGDKVPTLRDRIGTAVELAPLMKSGEVPQAAASAFVVPLGFRASEALDATGLHTQSLYHRVAVILVIEYAGSAGGGETIPEVSRLEAEVLHGLAGYEPPSAWGPLVVERGALLGLKGGVAFYQVDFSIQQLLRVDP